MLPALWENAGVIFKRCGLSKSRFGWYTRWLYTGKQRSSVVFWGCLDKAASWLHQHGCYLGVDKANAGFVYPFFSLSKVGVAVSTVGSSRVMHIFDTAKVKQVAGCANLP